MERGLGPGWPRRFIPWELGWERGKKGDSGHRPDIFKGPEVHKIMGFWGNNKRLFVAGAQGAW